MPLIRRNTVPEPKGLSASQQIAQAEAVETTPFSSTSTQLNTDYDQESLPDFDSLLPSSKPSSRLQKLKLGFTTKVIRPEVADKQVDQASIASTGKHIFER
jgi:hypothetical protein